MIFHAVLEEAAHGPADGLPGRTRKPDSAASRCMGSYAPGGPPVHPRPARTKPGPEGGGSRPPRAGPDTYRAGQPQLPQFLQATFLRPALGSWEAKGPHRPRPRWTAGASRPQAPTTPRGSRHARRGLLPGGVQALRPLPSEADGTGHSPVSPSGNGTASGADAGC